MRQNHSTGKRLGIIATGISAAAIAVAAATGATAVHAASAPGPQQEGATSATPDPQHK